MDKPQKYKASDYTPYKGISRTPGETIKALRELHKWSQVELSGMTSITASHDFIVGNW